MLKIDESGVRSMTDKKVYFQPLLIILLLLVLHSPAKGIDTLLQKAEIKPIKGGQMAPNFYLENLNGKKVDLKQYRGKIVFLNFWATWCGPCKEEMPSMEALYQKLKERNFVFLTISVDYDEKKKVKDFIDKHRYTFPVLIDPKCVTLDLFGVKGIPATILIDKNGRMVGRAVGPRDWKSSEIVSILNHLLEK